jgi:hypothetical protein
MEYNTQVGIFETGEKDSQGGAYKDNRFLALRKRELNEYEVKDGVAIIGDRAFFDAKLSTVTLPNSLRAIGQSAFAGCKNLTDVALPEGLEVIKDTAFRDCESLAELALPSTLLEVGARAFGPGLKRLVILSENVTFSPDAFKQAKSLEEILVPEAACAKYTVWFVALGLTAKITEIKEKNEIEESNTGNNSSDIDNIDKCVVKIKDHLHELGMNEFVLYTCDYCGDLEWNEDFESLDSAVSLNLYFDLHETFNGEERTFIAPRKIKIKGDDLLIDLEEVKEYNEGEEEVLGCYESQSVDALLERFETSDIEKCFTEILAHTFNSDIISLNQQEDDEEQKEEYAEPQDESAQCNCVKESQIVALLKYYVEGELYSKYVFVHDGNYCVDAENHGDISFADCDIREDEKWLNFDECYCLGISSNIPVSQCEQDIIDSFYGALEDEGEFEYLTDLDETHLEYQ